MINQTLLSSAKIGTAGGFLTVVLANINTGDLVKTAVMAATGAAVSFLISVLLKYCISRWHK